MRIWPVVLQSIAFLLRLCYNIVMITRVSGETPPGLKRRLGQWRLERVIGDNHQRQLSQLALLQAAVESQLIHPVKKRELATKNNAGGLSLSVMAAFKLNIALVHAAESSQIQDYDIDDYSNYLADICHLFTESVRTTIAGVTVPRATKGSDVTNMSNVYLDLALSHEDSGAAYAYEKIAAITGYSGLVLPRTSHVRIMSVRASEATKAQEAVGSALNELSLGALHLDALSPRRVGG